MAANAGIVKNLTQNSNDGGVVIVTMTGSDVSPSAKAIQSCLVQRSTGTTAAYMNINAAATSSSFLISGSTLYPVPITDLSMLHFLGTASDTIQILWRG
jgi:hypothetical protein